MLTAAEAQRVIAENLPDFGTETVDLAASGGRVLRESISAERDQPPFDRVTMDGIAIRFAEYAHGRRAFSIAFTQHAGDPIRSVDYPADCAEVMTGCVLPPGTDTVVPVERISVRDSVAHLDASYDPTAGQFVHRQASDHAARETLLEPGIVITATEIAIIASSGRARVEVARSPVSRIVSTGNELVPPGQPIDAHQIRLSNSPALAAMLSAQGFSDNATDHLADEPKLLREGLANHLARADVLVLSGGVSMGKADFVPQVLSELGVQQTFHRIRQRPGKPMWFGRGENGQAVFALPGNPVSALVCCRQYVLPALFAASGRTAPGQGFAQLGRQVDFDPTLTCFMPVRVAEGNDGRRLAEPVLTNTSGDFAALGGTSGYVELDANTSTFTAGTTVPYHPWDTP